MSKFILKPLFIFLVGLILIGISGWLNFKFQPLPLLFAFIVVAMVLAYFAPLLIRIIFKAKPYSGKYHSALLEFAEKENVNLRQIYVRPSGGDYDGMAAGWLNNKVVFVSQNFLESHPFDEIEAVFAHELGHHSSAYVSIHAILIAAIIFLAGWLESLFWMLLPYPILSLILVSFLSFLLVLVLSRKGEYQADVFAKKSLSNPSTFGRFLNGYIESNRKSGLEIPKKPWYRFLYTHPWVWERIAFFEGGE